MTSIYDLNRSCKNTEKDCCPPFPHYTMPISDGDFVERNIELSNQGTGIDTMDTLHQYIYPGSLEYDESKTLSKCEYAEWKRQEDQARRNIMPTKFWQDLNAGRQGYARGLSDNLDETMIGRNNWPSGWINGVSGAIPGDKPWRDPYLENYTPIDPMNYRKPIVNNATMGNRHYFYSIYDLDEYPEMFCKCERSAAVKLDIASTDWRRGGTCANCGKRQMVRYPERYN